MSYVEILTSAFNLIKIIFDRIADSANTRNFVEKGPV